MPVLVISSAKAAEEIMKTHDLTFSDRPNLSIASKLFYEAKDVGFVRYGEYWRRMKALCVLQLLNNKRVRSFCTVREEETALMIEKIKQSCSSSSSTTVNLSEMLVSLANGVVCRVALGRKHSGRKFKELLGEFVELLGVFNLGDYIPWLAWVNSFNGLYKRVDRVAKELDDFLESVVEEHMDLRREKSGGERVDHDGGDEIQQDFVDVLLDIQRDNKVGFPVDRDSIKALILEKWVWRVGTTFQVTFISMGIRRTKETESIYSEGEDMSPTMVLTVETRNEDDELESQYQKGVKNLSDNGIEKLPNKFILPISEKPNLVLIKELAYACKHNNLKLTVIDFA
ncbi:Cytochrome P450 71A2 [Camellia lanceoleosa]|uniref:Cytochrome P450 71A2 n=1 Tax=Camellia lanceoleosa TaxID=1840588 RepID=A0ACC0HZV3_9ERIC|nr:Cytochrome P450 71A2 [Camellia lanceoleosa]